MKKLELNQMEIVEGGKFWGSQEYLGECINGVVEVTNVYYVFWAGFITSTYHKAC